MQMPTVFWHQFPKFGVLLSVIKLQLAGNSEGHEKVWKSRKNIREMLEKLVRICPLAYYS